MWATMILKRFFKIPALIYTNKWLHYSGYILSVIESLAGIGLLFSKTKKIAAIMMIVMHLFTLVFIGPMWVHYNKIVWP